MPTRRSLLRVVAAMSLAMLGSHMNGAGPAKSTVEQPTRPNVLLITADDMNWDAPGFAGNPLPGLTPNLDRLASQGTYFRHGHVTCAVCQPSRSVLMTGRYPHRNGADGFKPIRSDVPTLGESLRAAGYVNGIMAKTSHLAPAEKFCWDAVVAATELGQGRDPALYYRHVKEFIEKAKREGKPFFLMANSQDPHRPFAGSEKDRGAVDEDAPTGDGPIRPNRARRRQQQGRATTYPAPSRVYSTADVPVPAFLPDLPGVRAELAQYYASVRRCDETVGQVLRALEEAGLAEDTLVIFLSDNGMSQPFAKSNCYLASTRTPWVVRWPRKVPAGRVDETHFVSGIDLMPTVLQACGVAMPDGVDGRSFLALCTGRVDAIASGRDHVFTTYNETSGRRAYPMRCLQTARYGYVYNAWSDGKTAYRSEPMGGMAFAAMERAATTNPAVAERVEVLEHRTPEELYDLEKDPACLRNLVADPARREQLEAMRRSMTQWMREKEDPLAGTYQDYLAQHAR